MHHRLALLLAAAALLLGLGWIGCAELQSTRRAPALAALQPSTPAAIQIPPRVDGRARGLPEHTARY